MARPASLNPTDLELEILKILWQHGPGSVRQVREALAPTRKLAHTSVITTMNIMTEKGYLERDSDETPYIFRAKVTQDSVCKRMLRDLVHRAFGGSTVAVMLNLLDSSQLEEKEIAELRQRLNHKRKDA
jgi:BlaI family transcriptional regulator, penicillinase repressor